MFQILENPDEIRKGIAQKDPFELCMHELRWLIVNDLFGEEYDRGIFGTTTIPIRLYRWYQQHNPLMVKNISVEEFAKTYVKEKFRNRGIGAFGFCRLNSSYRYKQNIRHLLVESGEVVTERPSAFPLWTYSHGQAVAKLENMVKYATCGDLDCVICGGIGHRERLKSIMALSGLMFNLMGTKFIKVAKEAYEKKLQEFNGDFEEFLKWAYSQRTASIVSSPEEYKDVIEEIAEEIAEE